MQGLLTDRRHNGDDEKAYRSRNRGKDRIHIGADCKITLREKIHENQGGQHDQKKAAAPDQQGPHNLSESGQAYGKDSLKTLAGQTDGKKRGKEQTKLSQRESQHSKSILQRRKDEKR